MRNGNPQDSGPGSARERLEADGGGSGGDKLVTRKSFGIKAGGKDYLKWRYDEALNPQIKKTGCC